MNMDSIQYRICGFFSEEELEKMQAEQNGLTHPIIHLISDSQDSENNEQAVRYNTWWAMNQVKNKNLSFFEEKKKILLKSDRENASAVLGEIRCYAMLIGCFGIENAKIVPVNKSKTPDFCIEEKGEKIFVEVKTIQMNGDVKEKVRTFNKEPVPKCFFVREFIYCPYGEKTEKTPTQTVIEKLAFTKSDSGQFQENSANILWVDLQDNEMYLSSYETNQFFPIFSNGCFDSETTGFWSNVFWYALYAPKGLNIFEGVHLNCLEGRPVLLTEMECDGKFVNRENAKISAVIYSTPKAIVLCENPFATVPLPEWFLEKVTSMKRFKIESSICSFNGTCVKNIIQKERDFVEKLAKKEFYRF